MTTNGMTITHKLEAHGSGQLKASQLAALAGLVPDEARIDSKSESHRNESAWTWTATWDHSATIGAGVPVAIVHLVQLMDNGKTARCQAVSTPENHERFGVQPFVQCEKHLGHSTLRNGIGHDYPKAADQ